MAPVRDKRSTSRRLATLQMVASAFVFFLGALSLPYLSLVPIVIPAAVFGLGAMIYYSSREA